MRDVVFEEGQLDRIGVVCPDCGTESVFDLSKNQSAHGNRPCPGCGRPDFIKAFDGEPKRQFNCVTAYQRILDMDKRGLVRLYFKSDEL